MNACYDCEPTHNRDVRERGRCSCPCHSPVPREARAKVTTTDALAIACPVCGSDPGIVCIDPDESIPFDVHRGRYERAAEIEPCADCGHPVLWSEERGSRFHTEPGHRCFLNGAPEDLDPEPVEEEDPADLGIEVVFTASDGDEAIEILEGLIDRIRREGLQREWAWVVRDVNGNTVGDLTVAEVPA